MTFKLLEGSINYNTSIIKPLNFVRRSETLHIASALSYQFSVYRLELGQWEYAVWDKQFTAASRVECESQSAGVKACNEHWRQILAPFLNITS